MTRRGTRRALLSQKLGMNIIVNPNFSNWTGDDPDDWTLSGEVGADPEVSEVGSGQGHGGIGIGACNFFSSATANQPRIFQGVASGIDGIQFGVEYRYTIVISFLGAGVLRAGDSNTGGHAFNTVGTKVFDSIATSTNVRISGDGAAPINITIDSLIVQRILR